MSRKTIAGALGLALVFVLLPATLAVAEYRGTDMWSNLAPSGPGGLADQHPLSYYSLDYHVDGPSVGLGGPSAGDIPAMIAQFFASMIFTIITFFMRVTISAFDWAFNVDIIGGRHGVLRPVGEATQQMYFSTFVPLIATAVLIFGGWLIYKTLGRKFGEAGVGFIRAVCLTAAAMTIIFNPVDTIGQASGLSRELSGSIASGTTGANGGQDVSDRLFETFIYKPWAVLEFGGLKRCVSAERDADGFPKPVGIDDSSRTICRNALQRYAPAFLQHAPDSDERKKLYEAIKDGKAPYDKADAPAVDMMQAGGAVQRLAYVSLLAVGMISAILLLGLICFASLFAQLGVLVLLALTPAMVIAALFPGFHGIFWAWAKWIGKLLISVVVFSLLLSAAMGLSAALMEFGGEAFGYLGAFALQSVLFIGLFVKRKALAEMLTSRRDYSHSESRTKAFVGGAATGAVGAVTAPSTFAAATISRRLVDNQEERLRQERQQKPAPEPDDTKKPEPGRVPADSSSPPAGAGREYSPNPVDSPSTAPGDRAVPAGSPIVSSDKRGDPMPTKTFREDYEKARVELAEYNKNNNGLPLERPKPKPLPNLHAVHSDSLASSFPEELEREREKQQKAKSPE